MPRRNSLTSRLPIELYRYIIGYVRDRATLLTLLVTSRALAFEAERRLYGSLRVSFDCSAQTVRLLQQLGTNRRVASKMISMHIDLRSHPTSSPFGELSDQVKAALEMTANLTELTILVEVGAAVWWIPDNPQFKLRIFTTNTPLDHKLVTFLSTQVHLFRAKFMTSSQTRTTIPATAMPDLRVLSTDMDTALDILPGRNVTCLQLTSTNDTPICPIPATSVRRLEAPFRSTNCEQVGFLFPNVEFLRAQFSDSHEISDCIMVLPHLKHLHLIWEAEPNTLPDASVIAATLFLRHPALAVVDIVYHQIQRFERDSAVGMSEQLIGPGNFQIWSATDV